jgi:cellulose synthase/poly-beta-1,6-N-acetylglucosamine synthase-like glycosyltransferase
MIATLHTLLEGFGHAVVGYFILVNIAAMLLLLASGLEVRRYLRKNASVNYQVLMQSELVQPISIVAPAYNEEATVVGSVLSLLRLNYARTEVIVVNDGSKDDTLGVLLREFDLRRTRRLYAAAIPTKAVRGIYVSRRPELKQLVVVDKENGGKADALNTGLNVSRYPLFCAIDADSILEDDALQRVAKPFLEDQQVVAAGGIVRIANDCVVQRGRIRQVLLSHHMLPLFQIVEYFRAFLSGRMGWSRVNGLLIVSGAFGLFRKDLLIQCGGYASDTVGEDMELVVRLHRYLIEHGIPYRIVFVPDPVCWTEAPSSLPVLARQRNRWHRGLLDTLLRHRDMVMRPRYGTIGLLAMPYFVLIELLAPVVEAAGYLLLPLLFLLHLISLELLVTFFMVSVAYGVFLSVGAVLLEEISFHRYPHPRDLARLLLVGIVENFGYRQLTVVWRLRAFVDHARGIRSWGAMQRVGWTTSGAAAALENNG